MKTPVTHTDGEFAKAVEILFLAKQNGIEIILHDGQVQLKMSDDKNIDDNLLQQIKSNKQLLIEYLNNNWNSPTGIKGEGQIKKFDRDTAKNIPLSFGQERLWFIDKLEGSVHYHFSDVFRVKGNINTIALQNAIQTIINRHEVLRTVILEEEAKPRQGIKEKDSWQLQTVDGSQYINDANGLQEYIDTLIKEPFDLSRDFMIRAHLITLNDDEHLLVLIIHHISFDKWSRSIFLHELNDLYASRINNTSSQLTSLDLQYADYSAWQRENIQGDLLADQIGYWKNKLADVTPLQLPLDFQRPVIQSSKGGRTIFNIDKKLTGQLKILSTQQGCTLFMTIVSAFKVLLFRYTGQQDIAIGTSIADRHQEELEAQIGFFLNTLVLRTEVNGNLSFIELLQQVKINTLEAYKNKDVPFEKVVDVVMNERDLSKNALFQVMLEYATPSYDQKLKLGNAIVVKEKSVSNSSKFDITFFITETPVDINIHIDYNADIFKSDTIKMMTVHLKELLSSIVKVPDNKISILQILTSAEKNQLLIEFNDTLFPYPDKNVIELFEQQVINNPEAIAIIFEEQRLTYQQLNERANRLARYLLGKGVKDETLVPICIDRSIEMIVGILAIVKSGAAYVPVDPKYPLERINYMIKDVAAKIILTNSKSGAQLQREASIEIISIDNDWINIEKQSGENLDTHISPNQLVYVIYTSGSTGKPKGVMIEHRSLLNYLINTKTRYIKEEETSSGTFIHLSNTFDASLTAMFMPMLSGKSIVIGPANAVNVFEEKSFRQNAPYNFLKVTPSHLELLQQNMIDNYNRCVTKRLVIGGEALFLSHFNYWIQNAIDVEVINEYGPTEATVGCTTYSFNTLGDNQKISNRIFIGKPIDNMQLYILDSYKELVPIRVTGELCISGEGLARGYLNQPELTAEKFISHSFDNNEAVIIYRTGDMGRWLPDGNIEYIGRKDDQVKIRGYRIELGEIESILQQSKHVSQSAVIAKEDNSGSKRLVGYIVPNGSFDREAIITELKEKLPEYMIPGQWITIDNMPITSNGKTNRKKLSEYNGLNEANKDEYVAPANELEKKLIIIWQELLEVDRIGVHDNFFQSGGHSLLAIQLISIIRKELDIELSLQDVFQFATIFDLVKYIELQTDTYSNDRDLSNFEIVNL